MIVCIVSDSHDNRRLLGSAVADAKAHGAQAVLHCGDVVAPSTLNVLKPFGLPLHVIHGNNMGDLVSMCRLAHKPDSFISFHGADAGIELAGRKIFLVHFPHYAHAMACTGDWDLVCFGHNHQAEIRHQLTVTGSETLLINPGTVGGVGANPTYCIGDLATMKFDIRPVPN